MAFPLTRSNRGGSSLSYSPDDPTSANDSTVLVFQTTEESLWIRQEDGSYEIVDKIINAHSELPPPSTDGDDDNKIAVSNDGIYYVNQFQTAATEATASWATYTATGYRGAQATQPQRGLPGETYYDTVHHKWQHVVVSNGDNYWVDGGNPTGWIAGNYTSQADALRGINRLIRSGVTTGVVWTGTAVERFSNFVHATSAETQRRWNRVAATTSGGGGTGLTEAEVKGEIRQFAQVDEPGGAARTSFVDFISAATAEAQRIPISATTGVIPDGRIPTTVARDLDIEDAALNINGDTRWPAEKLPTTVLYRDTAVANFPSGLTRDAEVAGIVRVLTTADFPALLARTSALRSDNAVKDLIGAMVSGNTETGISVSYQSADRTLDFVVDTPRTDNEVKDLIGEMVTGNTETGITVTYQSADRTLDFVATAGGRTADEVKDLVGEMVTGNTETGITVTYDSATHTLDFAVTGGGGSRTDNAVKDLVGAMVTGNTETGVTVTYDSITRTLDFVVATQRTDDEVKDLVGEMVSSNTETGITVTYDSVTHTLDFVGRTDDGIKDLVGAMVSGILKPEST